MNERNRIAEIEARLTAATPGPWGWDTEPRRGLHGADGEILRCSPLMHPENRNAEFIANSSADIAFLLAELSQAWEQGFRACNGEWEQTADIVTPDEDRFVAKNPYRSERP